MYVRPLSVIALRCSTNSVALTIPVVDLLLLLLLLLLFIIYIRQSQQTEVFLLGALNDYEDARGKLAENRRSE